MRPDTATRRFDDMRTAARLTLSAVTAIGATLALPSHTAATSHVAAPSAGTIAGSVVAQRMASHETATAVEHGIRRPTSNLRAARRQLQVFDLAIDPTSNEPGSVTGSGPISGVGTVEITAEHETGRAFHVEETWTFPAGELAVRADGVTTSTGFDTATCVASSSFVGVVEISGGADGYAAARGHGLFGGKSSLMFAPEPDGGCSDIPTAGAIHGRVVALLDLSATG
jgi:hypothetical protein